MYKLLPILLFAYSLAVTTEDIYDNSYALLIGIDEYENVQPLNYAVKDAESIHDILVNTFDFPNENPLEVSLYLENPLPLPTAADFFFPAGLA